MKNIFQNPIAGYALAFGLAVTQLSCSSDTKSTTSTTTQTAETGANESEAAYTDFKNYVSNLDSSAIATMDTASANWKDQRNMYNEKLTRLDQYTNDFDENRKMELDNLKTRYDSYWNSRSSNLSGGLAPEKVTNPTTETSTSPFNVATIAALTPTTIRQAYDNLVERVRANKNEFSKAEWEKVDAYYKALDDRRDALQSQLTDKDKYEITKAKAKYVAAKTGEKVDSGVSQATADVKQTGEKAGDKIEKGANQVGQNVKETSKDAKETGGKVADKVGTAAKNTAQDVAETGSKVGNKVGHAAKETGKDVKEGVVKGAKAVGKTADKAGEKVKDAFDGKKENE